MALSTTLCGIRHVTGLGFASEDLALVHYCPGEHPLPCLHVGRCLDDWVDGETGQQGKHLELQPISHILQGGGWGGPVGITSCVVTQKVGKGGR